MVRRWLIVWGVMLGTLLVGYYAPTSAILQAKPNFSAQISQLGQNLPISAYITIAGRKLELEVARTQQQQAMGLMYRTSLADNRGMLFVFNSPQQTKFWMKNVRIPLDMIFLRNGKVQAIAASVPPCNTKNCPTYGPDSAIDRVIELRGGLAAELGLNVGDRVQIKFLDSPTRS